MPIYEYECPKHGIFEVYAPTTNFPEIVECQEWSAYHNPRCGLASIRICSLVSMQPDTMWSGYQTEQGYFTSKSEYNKVLKEKNLETITHRELETVRKNVAKIKKDKKEKQLNNLRNHLTNELKDVTIDPDGNTLKERNTYVRTRNKPE